MLRRFPYGESSLLVHALTPEHGRVSLLAKGAYRIHSGYFGVLDLFHTLRVAFRTTERSELALLSSASVERTRPGIPRDLSRYRLGLGLLELAQLGAREGHEEPGLFELLERTLEVLEMAPIDPRLVESAFELHFLRERGWTPALEDCASCGNRVPPPRSPNTRAAFSPALGGELCAPCTQEARARRAPLEIHPAGVLRVARSLLETPIELLPRVHLDPARIVRVRGLVRRFLEYHLEVRPRSFGTTVRRAR